MNVAILVPFRDEPAQKRTAHLARFCAEMPALLSTAAAAVAGASFCIYVGHAVQDGRPFARGRCLNALFKVCMQRQPAYTRVILHDVDLLPDAVRARAYFTKHDTPVCALARIGGEYYDSKDYIGGVLALDPAAFTAVNGFPNEMEGWGGEDDALFDRLREAGIAVCAEASGLIENMELYPGAVRARDTHACPKGKRRALRAAWKAGDPALTGVAELVFAASALPSSPHVTTIHHLRVLAPVSLLPGWRMAFSSRTQLPYFIHDVSNTKTYLPPQGTLCV